MHAHVHAHAHEPAGMSNDSAQKRVFIYQNSRALKNEATGTGRPKYLKWGYFQAQGNMP